MANKTRLAIYCGDDDGEGAFVELTATQWAALRAKAEADGREPGQWILDQAIGNLEVSLGP
jgi:hypothetical protein